MEISEYQQLFLSEAREILQLQNKTLVELEKNPADVSLFHELFRLSHTFKSMAQTMGYDNIAQLTHSMESTLAVLKSEVPQAETDIVNLLFKSLDTLDTLIEDVQGNKIEPIDVAPLIERFDLLASTISSNKGKSKKTKTSRSESSDNLYREVNEGKDIEATASTGEIQSVRIPLTHLDSLMDITGELAINKIQLDRISKAIENETLEEVVAQMSRLTSQLQDQMMQIRLIPLEHIFSPYHRLVRDIAVAQKKEIDLIIEGSNIGLDRSIQDEINEPLIHIIKNAVTHGIEEPKLRKKLGKERRGTIKLIARREKNSVVLELSDDGRGMDIEEIKEAAIATGVISEEELLDLTEEEIAMLITYPGYTRAKTVTEAAGRGMGLNVSRVKVESLGGTLNIDSKPKEGTTIFLKLPLTMAIVQAMLIGIENETYCIPLSFIAETIKVSKQAIRTMEHHDIISYRDSVLPLIQLRKKLGFPTSGQQSNNGKIPIVVVEVGSNKAGLIVDRLLGQQDVVIKTLTGMLTRIKNTSGATILGTGKVALIIDIASLFKKEI
ncbi:MAG: chemotaxis protein CheA [Candidatus Neomarinimicrobiota bacterium]